MIDWSSDVCSSDLIVRGDAAGTREILECYFEGRPIRDEYLIVDGGKLAGTGARSYASGNATGGTEEGAQFRSEERRVGRECVRTWRSRWSAIADKKKMKNDEGKGTSKQARQ